VGSGVVQAVSHAPYLKETAARLVVLEYGIDLESGLKSIFAGLGLGLGFGFGLGLAKICNQVHFQFSLCTFAVFCLGRMTFCKPVSYTQPKISVTYLIFTAELTHGFACPIPFTLQ